MINMRNIILRLCLLLLVVSLQAFQLPSCEKPEARVIGDLAINHPAPLEWTGLEPGLEFSRLEFVRKTDGQEIKVAALKIDPEKFRFTLLSAPLIKEEPVAWVHEMAEKTGPVLAVNASFYMLENNEPIGLLVMDGEEFNPWGEGAGSGVFWIKDGRARIDRSGEFVSAWEDAELAVQAGPLVVEPGGKPGIYRNVEKHRARTAVGIDNKGDVVMVCTFRGEEGSGLDLFELMQIMMHPRKKGGLGLKVALNLDGGTSSAMFLDHPGLDLDIRSTHPVRNAIALERR
jgi:uncharacterized protein YigE (DUF2233 family)